MKTFVNALTIIRILATIILPLLWIYIPPIYLLIFVIIILLTDVFDGVLARRFHVQSLFGTLMDAIADKIFGIILLLIIASYHKLFYIILTLELLIAFINFISFFYGATTKSSILGKIKMWFLGIAAACGIIYIFRPTLATIIKFCPYLFNNIELIIYIVVGISSGAQIMVFFDYAINIFKELKGKKQKIHLSLKTDKELKYNLFNTEFYLEHKDDVYSNLLFKD